jgi:hypothetical protein
MITFKNLGNMGRLGNQMFQFAFIYNVAKHKNLEIGYDYIHKPLITKIFDLPLKDSTQIAQKNTLVQLNDCAYIDTSTIEDNTDCYGYFQNSKYVYDIEYELKNLFVFKKDMMDVCFKFIKELKDKVKKELVSVHVRRSDYLLPNSIHTVCDDNYFKKAMDKFGNDYFYVIFTDDKEFCKNKFKNIPNIIMDNSPEVDLALMSLCDHNILSNSSYSWWGSWLNENLNKKVIVPNRWYNNNGGPKNWEKIYRSDMVLL